MFRISSEEIIELTVNQGNVCDTQCTLAGRVCCVLCVHFRYDSKKDSYLCTEDHEACDPSVCKFGRVLLEKHPL